jgi:hypothetical protein
MKIKFLTPAQHDSDIYAPGDTADLPNAQAKVLIDHGLAESVAAANATEKTAAAEKSAASAALIAAEKSEDKLV